MAAKKSTGRKCSICSHKEMKAINSLIGDAKSFRGISLKYGMSDMSVARHAENCLNLEISALIKEKKIVNAINHYEEIAEQLRFAKDLRLAAREYLTDPETGSLILIPRADEIQVIYSDYSDCNERGEPKRKKNSLDALLSELDANNKSPVKTEIKHVDIRSFALNAISTVDLVLDKIAKVEGLYQKEKENEATIERTVNAYNLWLEDNPQATAEQKAIWVKRFALGAKVEQSELARRVGVDIQEFLQIQ